MYVIFTDIDGTLVDHRTYSYEDALPALNKIKHLKIPLVLASSKTRAEIEVLRKELEIQDPFIVENGGAIFIPEKYFSITYQYQKKYNHYDVIELGTHYSKLRQALEWIKKETGLPIRGFGDMTPEEIAKETGLSLKDALLARQREYDEPFFIENEQDTRNFDRLKELTKNLGLNLTCGSRFYHLMGDNDKGKAIDLLKRLFKKQMASLKTIGLGDSLNDLSMLKAVDLPILVQKPSGEYDKQILSRLNPILANDVGPKGWNQAILSILK